MRRRVFLKLVVRYSNARDGLITTGFLNVGPVDTEVSEMLVWVESQSEAQMCCSGVSSASSRTAGSVDAGEHAKGFVSQAPDDGRYKYLAEFTCDSRFLIHESRVWLVIKYPGFASGESNANRTLRRPQRASISRRLGSGSSPHYQVQVVDEDGTNYRLAINVLSQQAPSQVMYYIKSFSSTR